MANKVRVKTESGVMLLKTPGCWILLRRITEIPHGLKEQSLAPPGPRELTQSRQKESTNERAVRFKNLTYIWGSLGASFG